MCWRSVSKPIELVAQKNIPVFKIGYVEKNEKVFPYFFRLFNNFYEEGHEYEEKHIDVVMSCMTFIINRGIHSYSIDKLMIKPSEIIYEVPSVKVVLRDKPTGGGQTYAAEKMALLLCTIPKGTKYYINEIGEIVSEKIKVNEIIKRPFEKWSTARVNTMLNKWKKIKI